MKGCVLFLFTLIFFLNYIELGNTFRLKPSRHVRHKRDAVGALDIVTNNAQPIHAEVKPETAVAGKPCPKGINLPSHIEMGTVFQVTAPKDTIYEAKSLRKSWPSTNRLDFIRSISRLVTLATLAVSAVIEFYPLIQNLMSLLPVPSFTKYEVL